MKRKSTPPAPTLPITLSYTQERNGGVPSPQNDCTLTDTVTTVNFHAVRRGASPGPGREILDVTPEAYAAERLYLIVARYTEQTTYGKHVGLWEVVSVAYSEEEALTAAKGAWDNPFRRWDGGVSIEVHCFPLRDPGPPDPGPINITYHP